MTWFDGHVISGLERVAKPDRRIFEILLERYALAPETTVFVDDVPTNVAAARALGLNAVLFTGARPLRQALRAFGVPGIALSRRWLAVLAVLAVLAMLVVRAGVPALVCPHRLAGSQPTQPVCLRKALLEERGYLPSVW